jgi:hypothetical protein
MKYWDKSLEVRRRCWIRVELEPPHGITYFQWDRLVQEQKRWCQHYPSTGRFWFDSHYIEVSTWWFERPADATAFVLRWR